MSDDDIDNVGYKRPPMRTRFKEGISGNPADRSKKKHSTLDDIFSNELKSKIRMVFGKNAMEVSKRAAIVKRIIYMALNGNLAAAKLVLKYVEERDIRESPQEQLAIRMKGARESLEIKLQALARTNEQRRELGVE